MNLNLENKLAMSLNEYDGGSGTPDRRLEGEPRLEMRIFTGPEGVYIMEKTYVIEEPEFIGEYNNIK